MHTAEIVLVQHFFEIAQRLGSNQLLSFEQVQSGIIVPALTTDDAGNRNDVNLIET